MFNLNKKLIQLVITPPLTYKIMKWRAEEMAQQLRVPAISEALGSVFGTHIAAYNHL